MSELGTARNPGAMPTQSEGPIQGQPQTALAAATPVSGTVPAVEKSFLRRLLGGGFLEAALPRPATPAELLPLTMQEWLGQKVVSAAKWLAEILGFDPDQSPTIKAIIGMGEWLAGTVGSILDMCVKILKTNTRLVYERPANFIIPLEATPMPLLFTESQGGGAYTARKYNEESSKKLISTTEEILQQFSEAARREQEEEEQTKARLEQERKQAIDEARQIILEIDRNSGSLADNPKVRQLLATLEAPGVCLSTAIEMVRQLQLEELEGTSN